MQTQLSDSFCDRQVIVLARDIDARERRRDVRITGTSDQLGRGGFPFKIVPVHPPTRAR
jgi:hypothetical protein